MIQPPPAYGGHPPYPPSVPRRPARRRPSGWWFGLGGGLVVAAVVIGIGLLVWTLRPLFLTDASVPMDGQPHAVRVPADSDRVLWIDESVTPAVCRVVDRETSAELPIQGVDADFRRDNGSIGDRLATWRFDPGSGDLEVTCAPVVSSTVEIGPAPHVGSLALGILAAVLVPLALGLTGTVVLIVTGILFAVRPARPRLP